MDYTLEPSVKISPSSALARMVFHSNRKGKHLRVSIAAERYHNHGNSLFLFLFNLIYFIT